MTAVTSNNGRDSDRYCGAKKRQSEGTCTRPAGWGTDHPGIGRCKLHGGKTPDHNKAANVIKAERAVATYGLPRQVDPAQALLEEVHRTAGHVAWLGQLVNGLDRTELTQRGENGTTSPAVWIDIYQRERAHLARVAKSAVDAGIAERQVKLAEQQGALLASAVQRILDGLNLTPEQQRRVPEVVPAVLRQIEQGAA